MNWKADSDNDSSVNYPSECARERAADSIIHMLGVGGALVGGTTLIALSAWRLGIGMMVVCTVYVLTLLFSVSASALYHTYPRKELRVLWQRLDHAAIYALIAGTFTPLLVFIGSLWSLIVLAAVWLLSIAAICFKLLARNIEPRWSVASYLFIGWLGVLAFPEMISSLPLAATLAIVGGGLSYTIGTWFFSRPVMPFRYAIWHGFVTAGSSAFFMAICLSVFSEVSVGTI